MIRLRFNQIFEKDDFIRLGGALFRKSSIVCILSNPVKDSLKNIGSKELWFTVELNTKKILSFEIIENTEEDVIKVMDRVFYCI